MKRILVILLSGTILVPCSLYGDWRKTHWGMSLAEVKKCLDNPYEIPETPQDQYNYNIYSGDKTLLTEENYDVNGMYFNVRYIFDDKYKLKAINMVGDENYYFRTMSILSGKYGEPAYAERGSLPNATWNVPAKHISIRLSRVSHTIIRYEPITDAL